MTHGADPRASTTIHRWANRRLFDVAAGARRRGGDARHGQALELSDPQGNVQRISTARTVVWLARWKGESPARIYGDADFAEHGRPPRQVGRAGGRAARVRGGAGGGAIWRRPSTTGTPQGAAVPRWPLGALLQHVVNHATHHRSEAATMITLHQRLAARHRHQHLPRLGPGVGRAAAWA